MEVTILYMYKYIFLLFIYLFLAVLGLPCCACFSLVAMCGLFIAVAFLIGNLWLLAYSLQQLWCMAFVALRHVESSQTRDQTCVSCIGK